MDLKVNENGRKILENGIGYYAVTQSIEDISWWILKLMNFVKFMLSQHST